VSGSTHEANPGGRIRRFVAIAALAGAGGVMLFAAFGGPAAGALPRSLPAVSAVSAYFRALPTMLLGRNEAARPAQALALFPVGEGPVQRMALPAPDGIAPPSGAVLRIALPEPAAADPALETALRERARMTVANGPRTGTPAQAEQPTKNFALEMQDLARAGMDFALGGIAGPPPVIETASAAPAAPPARANLAAQAEDSDFERAFGIAPPAKPGKLLPETSYSEFRLSDNGVSVPDASGSSLARTIEFQKPVSADGVRLGQVRVRIAGDSSLSAHLGDLLSLFEGKIDSRELADLRSAGSSSEFVGFTSLRKAGLSINFDPVQDQLVMKTVEKL